MPWQRTRIRTPETKSPPAANRPAHYRAAIAAAPVELKMSLARSAAARAKSSSPSATRDGLESLWAAQVLAGPKPFVQIVVDGARLV